MYVDIPMMHLLAYYPNLDVSAGKAGRIRVPQLTTAAAGQIAIPFYTAGLTQKPIVSVKPTFQIPYALKYNSVAPPAYTTEVGTKYNSCFFTMVVQLTNSTIR